MKLFGNIKDQNGTTKTLETKTEFEVNIRVQNDIFDLNSM